MERQYKSLPQHIKKVNGRTITGIFSVFGNLDSYNDRIWPGSFAKTLLERGSKIVHLWQHDWWSPPIAVIKSIREVTREELPAEVLAAAPEALGGAEVEREYLDNEMANWVLDAIIKGAPLEMSFGFDAVKYDFEELPGAKYDWEKLRNLREIRLWETSDVLWGANDATTANKMPLELLLKHLERLTKAGARHSAKDVEILNAIHLGVVDLGATNCKGIADDTDADDEDDDKSRAEDASLTLAHDRLRLLELSLSL
jgi:HK97 family phage prohead protease